MSLYMMGLYCGCSDGDGDNELTRWFRESWLGTGKKLDMGKACIRFKKLADVPLEVIGEAIRRIPARTYIARYEEVLKQTKGAGAAKKAAAQKAAAPAATAVKKPAVKKLAPTKKAAAGRK